MEERMKRGRLKRVDKPRSPRGGVVTLLVGLCDERPGEGVAGREVLNRVGRSSDRGQEREGERKGRGAGAGELLILTQRYSFKRRRGVWGRLYWRVSFEKRAVGFRKLLLCVWAQQPSRPRCAGPGEGWRQSCRRRSLATGARPLRTRARAGRSGRVGPTAQHA